MRVPCDLTTIPLINGLLTRMLNKAWPTIDPISFERMAKYV